MATVRYLANHLNATIPNFHGFLTGASGRSDTQFTAVGSGTDFPIFNVVGSGLTYYLGGEVSGTIHSIEILGFKYEDSNLNPPYPTELKTPAPYLTITGLDTSLGTMWGGSPYSINGVTYYGFQAQLIRWMNGDDNVFGTVGNNLLRGYEGSNRYHASAGNDIVDGKYGFDTFVLEGRRSQYEISPSKAPIDGVDYAATAMTDGVNTTLLVDVERIEFSDIKMAFDLDLHGNAGWAARLIGSIVGKEALSETGLVGEVLAHLDAIGIKSVTELLVDSGTMAVQAGGADNASFFTLLYKNVMGKAPSQSELSELVSYIDSGAFTQAQALEVIAGLDLTANQIGLTGLAQAGLEYTYFAG